MKNKKMYLIVLMVLALLIGSLSACQPKATTEPAETQGSGETTKTSETTAAPTSTETTGEKSEITVWHPVGRFTLEDRRDKIPEEKDVGYLENLFNIDLKFTTVPDEQARDQLGIMLATNSMTDIIFMPEAYDTFLIRPDQLFADGQIIDLKTVESSNPTYMNIINENPVIMKNVMDDDGHILFFCSPIFEVEVGMSGGLMIRKDWLDKYDLELPQSIDDFLTALRAFRDNDPNGNGENDEVPFCGTQGSLQCIGNLIGVQETFSMVGGAGGHVVFGQFEEELYKKRLKLIATVAQEKLINENYYNFDFSMRDTWVAEDRVGSCLTGLGNLDKWNNLMADHPTFLMWPIDNPAQEDGKRYFDRTALAKAMSASVTVVSTNAKNPEKCAELLDYFYTEEGHLLNVFGVEGITYTMDDDFPLFTDLILNNPDGLGIGDAQGKYIGIPGARTYEDIRVWAQLSLTTPGSRQAAMRTWTDTFTEETNTPLPSAMMSEADADEYADIMADLQTYILESVAKFTTGEWDVDKEYSQFVEQCRVLGAERALELQDKAIKNWQSRGGVPYQFTLKRAQIDWSKIPLKTEKGIELMDPDLR